MPPLKNPRKGYEAQILGGMLLYKLAFLSEPLYIADDVGIDYSCTIFGENDRDDGYSELIPKNTFGIQIKKAKEVVQKKVDLTKHLTYLEELEFPYLIGIADLRKTSLKIYSGEFLTPFFAFKKFPGNTIESLKVYLCEKTDIPYDYRDWCHQERKNREKYVIPFPKIAELSANMNEDEIKMQSIEISKNCLSILNNIASYKLQKYLFTEQIHQRQLLFTNSSWGPNLLKNLIESLVLIFFHLKFMKENNLSTTKEEFNLYENIYKMLKASYGDVLLSTELDNIYLACKGEFESN